MLLGAHVSIRGGVDLAPARGAAIGATAIQVFTKSPNQWRDPAVATDVPARFQAALAEHGIGFVVAHDSYLINLASPDGGLAKRSAQSFTRELERCRTLGIGQLVSHPGNYLDDPEAGLRRNAARYTTCLREVDGVRVLLETTAGSGTALGARFEELAQLRDLIGADVRDRVGFCADTCHLYAAGYDLREAPDAVWRDWDRTLGLDRLWCLHLNDSKTPLSSRVDRHALIAEGTLGAGPFRYLMTDRRFRGVPKVLETPKGDDEVTNDRKMLRRLRAYARR